MLINNHHHPRTDPESLTASGFGGMKGMRNGKWSASRVALVCLQIQKEWKVGGRGSNGITAENEELITRICEKHKMNERHIRRILEVR